MHFQCDESIQRCWCVNDKGEERLGTRKVYKSGDQKPNCGKWDFWEYLDDEVAEL